MPELSVAIMASDDEQRTVLQMLVDGTTIARAVQSVTGYPASTADLALRRVLDLNPDVVMVDIPSASPGPALRVIEILRNESMKAAIFAVGDISNPQIIVNAMRSGAREFLERPVGATSLLEAFVRLTSAQRKARSGGGQRGRVFTVINAKGGSGATTVAVNVALALENSESHVALVDLAPLGHAALHLNLKPSFTVLDAFRNMHRLDASLLDSFMTRHQSGLHLLSGPISPYGEPGSAEIARVFDLLASSYRYVVVDASSRLDAAVRLVGDISDVVMLVACTDVVSLWSAARVCHYLGEGNAGQRVRLILNRFRKISGFSESDAEMAAGAKLLWKVPNHFPTVSAAIDRGLPVMSQNTSELARSFAGLAAVLAEPEESRRKSFSLFKTAT